MARRRSKKGSGLTENQLLHLLTGDCFDSMEGRAPGFPFRSDDHRRQLWRENRHRLIDKDVGDDDGLVKREPGTRPAAWWSYDAPEPRRIIKNAEYWQLPQGEEEGWRRYGGMHPIMHPVDGWSAAGYPLQEYESEADYLRRLGLLLPGEEEAMNDLKQGGDHNDR